MLSLPFDKTKDEIKEIIEQLNQATTDLKEHMDENNFIDALQETTGVKKKINYVSASTGENLSIKEVSSHEIEDDADFEDLMGPTLKEGETSGIK